MKSQQEFWNKLKLKYEVKNQQLQEREQELRFQLEAMDAIIRNCGTKNATTFYNEEGLTYGIPATQSKPSKIVDVTDFTGSRPDMWQVDERLVSNSEYLSCNPCEVDILNESGDLCNCSICSKYSLAGANGKKQCPCSYYNDVSRPIETPALGALATAFANLGSPSKLSLNSLDVYYLKNICDLAIQEKDLFKQVNDLEQKEKIYDEVFGGYANADYSSKCTCLCPCSSDDDQESNAQLRLDNLLLKNELREMRLEVRQYLERMEGPMEFKLESERYKCAQLEKELEEVTKKRADMKELYEKEKNLLKRQLCEAATNLYRINAMNDQMMQELQQQQKKHAQLQNELICRKLSEAETLKSLQACGQTNANAVKDGCDLHRIARELSQVLRECEPCGDCMNLPEDLTSTARLLKSLTDMVDLKLKEINETQNGDDSTPATTETLEQTPDDQGDAEVTKDVEADIVVAEEPTRDTDFDKGATNTETEEVLDQEQ